MTMKHPGAGLQDDTIPIEVTKDRRPKMKYVGRRFQIVTDEILKQSDLESKGIRKSKTSSTTMPSSPTGPNKKSSLPSSSTASKKKSNLPSSPTGPKKKGNLPSSPTGPNKKSSLPSSSTGSKKKSNLPSSPTGPKKKSSLPSSSSGSKKKSNLLSSPTGPNKKNNMTSSSSTGSKKKKSLPTSATVSNSEDIDGTLPNENCQQSSSATCTRNHQTKPSSAHESEIDNTLLEENCEQSSNAQGDSNSEQESEIDHTLPDLPTPHSAGPFEKYSIEEKDFVKIIERNILTMTTGVKWNSIGGLEEPKKLLQETVSIPMLAPHLFKGIRMPWKGILLVGPPGTGKTLLAKAVASECGATFFNVSPSTIASKWHGDSEKMIRLLFDIARHYAPSIIFIDEIDAVAGHRGRRTESESARKVKTELLTHMDGIVSSAKRIIVLGATNFPWEIDDAFKRRLEKRILIPLPDYRSRLHQLKGNLAECKLSQDVNLHTLAEELDGYSGSDLQNICRDAAMQPIRRVVEEKGPAALQQVNIQDLTINKHNLVHAVEKIKKTVSVEDVEKYNRWISHGGAS